MGNPCELNPQFTPLRDKTPGFGYELRSQSAARSPIMIVVALVLALITFGMTEASATMMFFNP